jgi:hypothetical protein
MTKNLLERYGPYPKKREKKRGRLHEKESLKQGSAWIKWKVASSGDSSFYRPCLTR